MDAIAPALWQRMSAAIAANDFAALDEMLPIAGGMPEVVNWAWRALTTGKLVERYLAVNLLQVAAEEDDLHSYRLMVLHRVFARERCITIKVRLALLLLHQQHDCPVACHLLMEVAKNVTH